MASFSRKLNPPAQATVDPYQTRTTINVANLHDYRSTGTHYANHPSNVTQSSVLCHCNSSLKSMEFAYRRQEYSS